MNDSQRRITSLALLIGGPVVGVYWGWTNDFYADDMFYPLIWTIGTVVAGLFVRAGQTIP